MSACAGRAGRAIIDGMAAPPRPSKPRPYRMHLDGPSCWTDLEGRQVIEVEPTEAAYFPAPSPEPGEPEPGEPEPDPAGGRVAFRFSLPLGYQVLSHLKAGAPVVLVNVRIPWLASVLEAARARDQLERYNRWIDGARAAEPEPPEPGEPEPPEPGEPGEPGEG